MELSTQIKEKIIQNYILDIDFKGDFSVKKIKNELKGLLHEMPAIDIRYTRDKFITEDLKGNKVEVRDEKVTSVVIIFCDGDNSDGTPKTHRVEYYV